MYLFPGQTPYLHTLTEVFFLTCLTACVASKAAENICSPQLVTLVTRLKIPLNRKIKVGQVGQVKNIYLITLYILLFTDSYNLSHTCPNLSHRKNRNLSILRCWRPSNLQQIHFGAIFLLTLNIYSFQQWQKTRSFQLFTIVLLGRQLVIAREANQD